MTDRAETGEPRVALERSLERSLREGPPDERGYRAERVDFNTDAHVELLWSLSRAPDADSALRTMVRLADALGNGWDELNRGLSS